MRAVGVAGRGGEEGRGKGRGGGGCQQAWMGVHRVTDLEKFPVRVSRDDSNTAGQKTLTNKDRMSGLVKHRDHHPSPVHRKCCLLYTSPSPRDRLVSRMPSSA